MPTTQQQFLAAASEKGAKDLLTALLSLPEDKRGWAPTQTTRSALNMVAECALNNGFTADLIQKREWTAPPFEEYLALVNEVAGRDIQSLKELLETNTARVAEVIRQVADEDMGVVFDKPFGTMTMEQSIAYPYWNASYHEGQIYQLQMLAASGFGSEDR